MYWILKDTTKKQRDYNKYIRRTYFLKTLGQNKGKTNLPLLLKALPYKIQWPSNGYYHFAGKKLKQPEDWPLPEVPNQSGEKDDFTKISPTKAFNPR